MGGLQGMQGLCRGAVWRGCIAVMALLFLGERTAVCEGTREFTFRGGRLSDAVVQREVNLGAALSPVPAPSPAVSNVNKTNPPITCTQSYSASNNSNCGPSGASLGFTIGGLLLLAVLVGSSICCACKYRHHVAGAAAGAMNRLSNRNPAPGMEGSLKGGWERSSVQVEMPGLEGVTHIAWVESVHGPPLMGSSLRTANHSLCSPDSTIQGGNLMRAMSTRTPDSTVHPMGASFEGSVKWEASVHHAALERSVNPSVREEGRVSALSLLMEARRAAESEEAEQRNGEAGETSRTDSLEASQSPLQPEGQHDEDRGQREGGQKQQGRGEP
eukprot:TRINITY_DN13624_c0_g1_i1.p1 TRINITY_DN13624_c0_g1~~TRINITY_DN13624_c0_g1_i1.p1  ORF type:complete len:329 (-),score=55.00 TRINITY_DN13624_c0_g1_i1:1059-2045(-)